MKTILLDVVGYALIALALIILFVGGAPFVMQEIAVILMFCFGSVIIALSGILEALTKRISSGQAGSKVEPPVMDKRNLEPWRNDIPK